MINESEIEELYFRPEDRNAEKRFKMAVMVQHIPTGLTAVCYDFESQVENKATAIARLEALLAGKGS